MIKLLCEMPLGEEFGKSWNWEAVSKNPNITLNDVLSMPNFPWDWRALSHNPNITMKDVLDHPELPWDRQQLQQNSNISVTDIYKWWPQSEINWKKLSYNTTVTINDILQHREKKWNWKILSRHVNMNDILDNLDLPWDFFEVPSHHTITMKMMLKYPNIKWGGSLMANPGITVEDMNFIISKCFVSYWSPWYAFLKHNPNITVDEFLNNPNITKDWGAFSANKNLKISEIKKYPNESWHWGNLSYNPNITIDDILHFKDKPWHQVLLFKYANITLTDILHKPGFITDSTACIGLSQNRNLTVRDVITNIDLPWNYPMLSSNWFCKKGYREIVYRNVKRYMAGIPRSLVIFYHVLEKWGNVLQIRGAAKALCIILGSKVRMMENIQRKVVLYQVTGVALWLDY